MHLNNQTYGLPKDFSTLTLFYNKNAFKELGITQPPTIWEELRRDSKKLTFDKNRDRRVDQYGLGITPELSRLAFMIKAFGGSIVDQKGYAAFATPEGLEGLQLVIAPYLEEKTARFSTCTRYSGILSGG